MKIIEYLNAHNGASVRQICEAVQLTRGTAYRLLETLRSESYLTKEPGSRHYWLTGRVLALSSGYSGDQWIERIARPVVLGFGEEVKWPVRLTTLAAGSLLVRISTDYFSPFTFEKVPSGRQVDLFTTASGHVYLAFSDPAEIETMLRFHSRASLDFAEEGERLDTRLQRIRDCGFEQLDYRQTGMLAVPVLSSGRIIACLTVEYFSRVVAREAAIGDLLPPLRRAAEQIGALAAAEPSPQAPSRCAPPR